MKAFAIFLIALVSVGDIPWLPGRQAHFCKIVDKLALSGNDEYLPALMERLRVDSGDALRLVIADRLDERDDHDAAEFIRVSVNNQNLLDQMRAVAETVPDRFAMFLVEFNPLQVDYLAMGSKASLRSLNGAIDQFIRDRKTIGTPGITESLVSLAEEFKKGVSKEFELHEKVRLRVLPAELTRPELTNAIVRIHRGTLRDIELPYRATGEQGPTTSLTPAVAQRWFDQIPSLEFIALGPDAAPNLPHLWLGERRARNRAFSLWRDPIVRGAKWEGAGPHAPIVKTWDRYSITYTWNADRSVNVKVNFGNVHELCFFGVFNAEGRLVHIVVTDHEGNATFPKGVYSPGNTIRLIAA